MSRITLWSRDDVAKRPPRILPSPRVAEPARTASPPPTLRKMASDLLHLRARLDGTTPARVLASDPELRACLLETERAGIRAGEPLPRPEA